jgi:hypothetical protein
MVKVYINTDYGEEKKRKLVSMVKSAFSVCKLEVDFTDSQQFSNIVVTNKCLVSNDYHSEWGSFRHWIVFLEDEENKCQVLSTNVWVFGENVFEKGEKFFQFFCFLAEQLKKRSY